MFFSKVSQGSASWSIASLALRVTLALMALQSVLLCAAFLGGGVISRSREYASHVFSEKVNHRARVVQDQMRNRWSRVEDSVQHLSSLPFVEHPEKASPEDLERFWLKAYPEIVSMMRVAGVTDGFIILSDGLPPVPDGSSTHKALYLRKTDPLLGEEEILLLVGSPSVVSKNNIYFSSGWRENLTFTDQNRDLLDKPLKLFMDTSKQGALAPLPTQLAYWGRPSSVVPGTARAITYSIPLLDSTGRIRGVFGVGVLESYFSSLLPARQPFPDGSLDYLVGYSTPDEKTVQPMISGESGRKTLLAPDVRLTVAPENFRNNIYRLISGGQQYSSKEEPMVACIIPLSLYAAQTPFENEVWSFMGVMEEGALFSFPAQIQRILLMSLLLSIVLGGLIALLVSRRVTGPIVRLSREVEKDNGGMLLSFKRTGVAEIDHLTSVIETANRNNMNTISRMLRIIDLAQVPMGVFEVKRNSGRVFATEGLRHIFMLSEEEAEDMYRDKVRFMERLNSFMSSREPEEDAVYKLNGTPEKWINLRVMYEPEDILGVVTDVTDDIKKKRRIRKERGYDALTGLCSRSFFRRQVATLLDNGPGLGIAAMLMLDLDKFKRVNDTYGHQCGDNYLCAVAKAMAMFASPHSVIGRRSGDEFFVFLFRLESRDALQDVVRRFFVELSENPFWFPDGTSRIMTLSLGLAWYEERVSYDQLLDMADTALYKAKQTAPGTMCEWGCEATLFSSSVSVPLPPYHGESA